MAETLYIDNAARKRIVTFWIPVCLGFAHFWATVCIGVIAWPGMPQINVDAAYKAFVACNWIIWGLILLLISDKAVELIISRLTAVSGSPISQVVEKTTTEKTVVTPTAPVQDMNVKAENVTVSQ